MANSPMIVEVTYISGLDVGAKLDGQRYDNRAKADQIALSCREIGYARCCNKNKTVRLYKDSQGNIWGVSTVKADRYFQLRGM